MSRFNLTFWGEILPGQDPEKVRARFAKLLDIRDAGRLEHFFSGETVILRRNIELKVAAEYYSKLRKLGVESALVKVDPETTPPPSTTDPTPDPAPEPAEHTNNTSEGDWEQARRQAELEVLERSHLEAEAKKRKERAALARQENEAQRRAVREEAKKQAVVKAKADLSGPKQVGKIDLDKKSDKEQEKK